MRPRVAQLHQSGAAAGDYLHWDGTLWVPRGPEFRETFTRQGALTVVAGVSGLVLDHAATFVSVVLRCNTAPTGADVIVDVNKNGTTIFTTQANRPKVSAGSTISSVVTNPDVTAFAAGDYLTVDIDQVGSTVAGSDLTATIRYHY